MGTKQHTLGFLLARASNSMATHLNSLLKKEGIDLPHSQYIVLKCLYDEDGISQQDLADKIYKDTAAIKRTLDILEKKRLDSKDSCYYEEKQCCNNKTRKSVDA